MYQPPLFREDDPATQHALIRAHPFGLLISSGSGGILADAAPFVLHPEAGARGMLRCHLSRANPHWQALGGGADVVVVFQGPEHYITPSWYASKAEHGKVVPTWNYAMVQVRGRARPIDDEAWLHRHVSDLTDVNEAGRSSPWALGDAPAPFVKAQLRGIVGVEVDIASIAGKWKASQNRQPEDQAGVVRGLTAEGDDRALAMAAIVQERNGI